MQKILTSTAHGLVKSITTSILRVTSVRLTTLASLILATLVLAACGGGGGGGGGGGAPNPSGVTTNPAGNIRDVFPDDGGTVSYTLNITRQNLASPMISLNVTTTITGACSISPAVATGLDYGTDNQTTPSFDITFTGTETVGGRCVASFAVNEITDLGTQTRRLTRTVAFSAEQAPGITFTLLGNAAGDSTNVPAGQEVRVNVTATKQDAGNNRDIAFPNNIVSDGSPSCTADLARADGRYNTAGGISTAVAIYNVRPTIIGAVSNCGVFSFTATEGSATAGSKDFSRSISFIDGDTDGDGIVDSMDNCPIISNPGQSDISNDGVGDLCDTNDDSDNDGIVDAMDVDADGDGLIGLHTAAQLNMMRYSLDGTNLTMTAGGPGNSDGCGGGSYANGTAITACNGYELMADIDLNDLPDNAIPGHNWEPVGACAIGFACPPMGQGSQFFSGTFSGNDFTISNLFINVTADSYGVGFFGAIDSTAQVLNVHIRGGNINRTTVISRLVGGLVGFGDGARISNSSVTLGAISGSDIVGGLVGRIGGGLISGGRISNSSVVIVGAISATESGVSASDVGGLVGYGDGARISSSVAAVGSISGVAAGAGGLVGSGIAAIISSSVAAVGSISGTHSMGGLVGTGNRATISSSVAAVGSISGTHNVGGLVGLSTRATISSSVATVGSIDSAGNNVGGLVGDDNRATISYSIAVTKSIAGVDRVGGLLGGNGSGRSASVTASYWDTTTLTTPDNRMVNVSRYGEGQPTTALQDPTTFGGSIYAIWANAYCNPNTGEYSATAPSPLGDYIRVWDLGIGTQYPAITCMQNLFSLADQREAARRALDDELPLVDADQQEGDRNSNNGR